MSDISSARMLLWSCCVLAFMEVVACLVTAEVIAGNDFNQREYGYTPDNDDNLLWSWRETAIAKIGYSVGYKLLVPLPPFPSPFISIPETADSYANGRFAGLISPMIHATGKKQQQQQQK